MEINKNLQMDPDNFKVIKREFFLSEDSPCVTFKINRMEFNSKFVSELNRTTNILMLFHEKRKNLLITSCKKNAREAFKWRSFGEGKAANPGKFLKVLFRKLNWDENNSYKLLGETYVNDKKTFILINLNVFDVYTPLETSIKDKDIK